MVTDYSFVIRAGRRGTISSKQAKAFRLRPIFPNKTFNAAELSSVHGDERQFATHRLTGDEQIVGPDWAPDRTSARILPQSSALHYFLVKYNVRC
jgi:hypothetical protein